MTHIVSQMPRIVNQLTMVTFVVTWFSICPKHGSHPSWVGERWDNSPLRLPDTLVGIQFLTKLAFDILSRSVVISKWPNLSLIGRPRQWSHASTKKVNTLSVSETAFIITSPSVEALRDLNPSDRTGKVNLIGGFTHLDRLVYIGLVSTRYLLYQYD